MDSFGDRPRPATAAQLQHMLGVLCAQPSSTGHQDDLAATAGLIGALLEESGLTVRVVPTPGAPVVLAWRAGRSPRRLLLAHHYDVPPPGPWSAWSHPPWQLAERGDAFYARGVAHGKGPLAAHLVALRALLADGNELPAGVVLVVEGERLNGSPHLDAVLEQHAPDLRADAGLSSAGERNAHGLPFCYVGSKGLIQVRLSARGAAHPLPPGMAASVVNPVWRLLWALNNVKGADEDIRLNGFYDDIDGLASGEREMLRAAELDEAGRMAAWDLPGFLFDLQGHQLVRSESTLPTCNITALTISPLGTEATLPTSAAAYLDFQLVPDQQPARVLEVLTRHLDERGYGDIVIEALPGSYAPVRTPAHAPLVQQVRAAGEHVYGAPLPLLSFGPFTQPLAFFHERLALPTVTLGVQRAESAIYAANERIPRDDLLQHGALLAELLRGMAEQPAALAVHTSDSTP